MLFRSGTRRLLMTLTDLNRAVSSLADRMEHTSQTSRVGEENVKELARGVNVLVTQMRSEQKVVREWMDEQAQHQVESASALRDVASRLQLRKE